MQGQWDVAKPLVQNLSQLQQQQQQQQQTIDEERRQPLYLATTTPAWGIADRSMKEEAMEEKNNDSGVSPDHYTSSNANSSFSPSSITSQDSTTMQCNTFDYSPQSMSKNYASLAEQAMDVVSSTAKSCSEDLMLEEYIMKCPICAVITTTRLQFSEHLPTHCMDKSDGPEFMRKVHEQLMNSELQQPGTSSSPTQGKRTEQEHEEADALPLVISQGKVKVHRCKYCNHIAITKTKLWEHKRIHIRKDKMLNCPKCPFVTEYKHHLEYHLRNHFGSKPFKCDQCSYACVNQSMLNSHLKSHSNVHPYRCADCPYAAKYCHTLKLHLRKSKHRPGMVLNADGSPNPLHIIDVYGTRRGPKQKPTKPKLQKQEIAQNSTVTTNINWQGVSTSPVSSPMIDNLPNTSMNGISGIMNTINTTNNGVNPINGMGAINDINAINSMNSMNPIGGLNVINPIGGMNGINPIAGLNGINPIGGLNCINTIGGLNGGVVPNRQMSYQYNKLYSQFPPVQFSTSAENQLGQLKPAALMEYAKSTAHEELPQNLVIKCKVASTANEMMHYSPSEQTEVLNLEVKTVPLDLSKSSITSRAQNKPAPTLAVRATGTSRRKGKAVKLDRRMIEEDTDEEQQMRSPQLMQTAQQTRQGPSNSEPSSSSGPRPGGPSFSGSSSDGAGCSGAGCSGASSSGATFSGPGCSGPSSSSPSSSGATENDDNDPEEPTDYYCKYCEIGFANIVMYTAHMEYHGLSDPHICKLCGLKCPEKISFFLHIARSKHT